ncbi:MAG: hypothetical protein HY675_26660 [Chloroflexi bacterium]|nr:hypothetical protein [Chloroflexota bacterium]
MAPLVAPSIEDLRTRQQQSGTSLGIIKPERITDFYMAPAKSETWTPQELSKLQRMGLFQAEPLRTLEKIPMEFHYVFRCEDARCKGHDMQCLDWEIYQAYRRWKKRYSDVTDFESKFLLRFKDEMINRNDTHFFVGTLVAHPEAWTIIGLFYPKKETS